MELDTINMSLSKPESDFYEVEPYSEDFLFTLNRNTKKGKGRWKYRFFSRKGSASTPHNDAIVYRLPYETGEDYQVSQSCFGTFTHNSPASRYAIDFAMEEGTPILAARSGRVLDVYDYSIIGGSTKIDYRFSNFVLIEHDDFTVAGYHHLKTNGAVVKKGDLVKVGQYIGYSGNTGYSTGPHLHFSVKKTINAREVRSVQVEFAYQGGKGSCL